MENIVLNTMLERSSIRAYTDDKLTDAELDALKKAALSAPTAMNRQDQRFIFAVSKDMRDMLEHAVMQGIIDSGNTEFAERIKCRVNFFVYGKGETQSAKKREKGLLKSSYDLSEYKVLVVTER